MTAGSLYDRFPTLPSERSSASLRPGTATFTCNDGSPKGTTFANGRFYVVDFISGRVYAHQAFGPATECSGSGGPDSFGKR